MSMETLEEFGEKADEVFKNAFNNAIKGTEDKGLADFTKEILNGNNDRENNQETEKKEKEESIR